MSPTVHVMHGLPASGKSTFARTLGVFRFNMDDYRAMMGITPDVWDVDKEAVAVEAMIAGAKSAILAGHDIVIDNTHVTRHLPQRYKSEFGHLGVQFVVHDFTEVPIQVCIRRDRERAGSERVGEEVIDRLATSLARSRETGWRLTTEWMNEPTTNN